MRIDYAALRANMYADDDKVAATLGVTADEYRTYIAERAAGGGQRRRDEIRARLSDQDRATLREVADGLDRNLGRLQRRGREIRTEMRAIVVRCRSPRTVRSRESHARQPGHRRARSRRGPPSGDDDPGASHGGRRSRWPV